MRKGMIRSPADRAAQDWIKSMFWTPEGVPVPLIWWFAKLYKGNVRAALDDINRACGTNYPKRRFREWERRQSRLPENLRKYVITEVLRAKLGEELGMQIVDFLDLRFEEPDYADLL